MAKRILKYPRKKLDWIPLTEPGSFDTQRQNVRYRYNEKETRSKICFSNIFNNHPIDAGSTLEICLNPKKNRYATKYSNLRKYVKFLNELYSGAKVSIFYDKSVEIPRKYGLWVRVKFTKEYPNVVLRDFCTRIRFLHEDPYQEFMDELLSKPDFKLSDIEEKVASLGDYAINSGHYLHETQQSIIKNYNNYEERVLKSYKHEYNLHDTLERLTYE